MGAVPQKKICWNCEGNVSREADNCTYCGVYLHAIDEDTSFSRTPSLYPLHQPQPSVQEENPAENTEDFSFGSSHSLLDRLKRDLFPLLFLMMGSVFFLFGIVLLLFSQNGVLTLQWEQTDGFYFFLSALPFMAIGWMFLQRLGSEE